MMVEAPVQLRSGYYDVGRIGAFCYLGGKASSFRHIESIGRFCSIAGNVVAGEMEHPLTHLSPHPIFQGKWDVFGDYTKDYYIRNAQALAIDRNSIAKSLGKAAEKIRIGNDVWIGEGVLIRRGVTIGDGAVIGSRSVVTKDIPPYAIAVGAPARVVRLRFSEKIIARLLDLKWWDYGLSATEGASMNRVVSAIRIMEENIASGRATLYTPPLHDAREIVPNIAS